MDHEDFYQVFLFATSMNGKTWMQGTTSKRENVWKKCDMIFYLSWVGVMQTWGGKVLVVTF